MQKVFAIIVLLCCAAGICCADGSLDVGNECEGVGVARAYGQYYRVKYSLDRPCAQFPRRFYCVRGVCPLGNSVRLFET